MPTLSITSLSKSFRAGAAGCTARVSVLRSLDLALWPGEIVALSGACASGRSTLLQCAAGLLTPDAGSIYWLGARAVPRDLVVYASERAHHRSCESSSRGEGALYAALHARLCAGQLATPSREPKLLIVDDLERVTAIERRLVLSLFARDALAGASVLFAADAELAAAPCVTRVVTLANGALLQRRKRSAARIAASSRDSRARASARSTYGRSLRSPQ